jgi:hypothetical protein
MPAPGQAATKGPLMTNSLRAASAVEDESADPDPSSSPSGRLQVTGESAAFESPPDARPSPPPPRNSALMPAFNAYSHWTRHVLGPGLELHVAEDADPMMRLRAETIIAALRA